MKLLPRIVLGFGLLMAGGGVWLLVSDGARRDAERVAALPRLTPSGLSTLASGAAILLEGRLASPDPAGPQGFLVYHHERFRGVVSSGADKGRPEWQRLGTIRPALVIEADGGAVVVRNRDYRLDTWPHQGMTDAVATYESMVRATERYLGFKAGDRVTIDGRVLRDAGDFRAAPQIEAIALFGGDAPAYVKSVRGGVLVFKIVGGVFLGFGLLITAAGVIWVKRDSRAASRR